MRTLPRETKLYTEKLINDLLFEAEMGHVTKATKIVSLLDSAENNSQVTLNRDASASSYYYPQYYAYPSQIAPPQQHVSQNSFNAYSFQTPQDMQPTKQVPTVQSLQIRSSKNNDLQQFDNEVCETDNLASFVTNFQPN